MTTSLIPVIWIVLLSEVCIWNMVRKMAYCTILWCFNTTVYFWILTMNAYWSSSTEIYRAWSPFHFLLLKFIACLFFCYSQLNTFLYLNFCPAVLFGFSNSSRRVVSCPLLSSCRVITSAASTWGYLRPVVWSENLEVSICSSGLFTCRKLKSESLCSLKWMIAFNVYWDQCSI